MKAINQNKAIELFLKADKYNWDEGYKTVKSILRNKNCDRGTALLIYWRASPEYFLRYKNIKDVPTHERDSWRFVHYAEQLILSDKHLSLIRFNPKSEMMEAYTIDKSILVRELPQEVYVETEGEIDANDILKGIVGPRAFNNAAEENDVRRLKKILANGKNPDFKNEGITPLMVATMHNALDAMKFLLENGADINFKDGYAMRALHRVRTVEAVELLLSYDARVDLKCVYGTALHLTASDSWNEVEDGVVQALVSGGAKPNVKNADGATALHSAARFGRLKNFQILLEAGWNLNAKDKQNRAVFHYAVAFPGWNHTNHIDRSELITELLKLGMSPDDKDNNNQSARELASYNANSNLLGENELSKIVSILEIELEVQEERFYSWNKTRDSSL